MEFSESFELPSSSLIEPEFEAKVQFVQILSNFLPRAIAGTALLPEPRPKKESQKLFFVRPILFSNKQMLYVFSTSYQYLGGASSEEILQPGTQDRTPRLKTNRIYYQIQIFPIQTVQEMQGFVTDFSPIRFRGGVFTWMAERDPGKPVKKFSEIFDEMDFSPLEASIREELKLDAKVWSLGKVYSPIGIDYLAFSLRFLDPHLPRLIQAMDQFYPVLEPGEDGVEVEALQSFHQYLARFQAERTLSKSGNMLWKIHFTDHPHP